MKKGRMFTFLIWIVVLALLIGIVMGFIGLLEYGTTFHL